MKVIEVNTVIAATYTAMTTAVQAEIDKWKAATPEIWQPIGPLYHITGTGFCQAMAKLDTRPLPEVITWELGANTSDANINLKLADGFDLKDIVFISNDTLTSQFFPVFVKYRSNIGRRIA